MNVDSDIGGPPEVAVEVGGESKAAAPEATIPPGWHHFIAADGTYFLIPQRYRLQRLLGRGAFGVVCSAVDTTTGALVAVKKVINCFDRPDHAKKIVRELAAMTVLRHHPKICELIDILLPPPPPGRATVNTPEDIAAADAAWMDVYFVMEFLPTDLAGVLLPPGVAAGHGTALSQQHIQYIVKQLVQGVAAIHRAGLVHRDLTPRNVLCTEECKVRVADFGLAREVDAQMTEYVVTRWYRAPEVMMGFQVSREENPQRFTQDGCDMWSVGCILAEMLGRGKVLLQGKNYIDQFQRTLELVGTPTAEDLAICPSVIQNWLSQMGAKPSQLGELHKRFPPPGAEEAGDAATLHAKALDFLRSCLHFNPAKRPSPDSALRHPYLDDGFESDDEPITAAALEMTNPLPVGTALATSQQCRDAVRLLAHHVHSTPSARRRNVTRRTTQ
eukprot:TRINITY_DN47608_c0_g1_i1.p1 TRINITY_DN47608_c0_g1~~TRINITY_DN47608_c0_g1_i1.p1  ORF type:complete len:492 (+),score=86.26 TRINITY_DN47608_c0_g1_i1:146-1477(+)